MDLDKFIAKEAIKRVNPAKEYSLLATLSFIPWIRDRRTLRGLIERGLLKAEIIRGVNDNGDRYIIRGRDIIEYIKSYSGLK